MDEIAKELHEQNIGKQKLWNEDLSGCLLWMDDVALIHHDKEEIQRMLNITDEIANRYHIKFGQDKSQILTIGNGDPTLKAKIGELTLENTNTYKYLGMTLNNKGNLENHLANVKGKVEAALQTIFNLAGNEEFYKIEMATSWRLVQSCIIPIITYGAETWIPLQKELKEAKKILDNTLKRIIRTPITTPTEIITAETGIWDIETQMAKKQISYYHRILTTKNPDSMIYKTVTNQLNPWTKHVGKILNMTKIPIDELKTKNKEQAKKYITKKLKEYQISKIYKAAETKSKVRDYICNKTRKTMMMKTQYMTKMQRKDCTNIFSVRSRMIKTKGNYKNNYTDLSCRWCHETQETQTHILKYCVEFKKITNNEPYETYFADDEKSTKTAAIIIEKITNKINNHNENPNDTLDPRTN